MSAQHVPFVQGPTSDTPGRRRRFRWPLVSLGLVAILAALSGWATFSQTAAYVYMSTRAGGDEVLDFRSGTAVVYAVLDYQDATNTRLDVQIFENCGVRLIEHSAIYDGTGRINIVISGGNILAGFLSATEMQSHEMVEAVDRARQASSAAAKRVRTASVVNAARTLDCVLAALERYPLPPATLDGLQTARDRAAEVDALGTRIMTEIPDDELDTALAELATLAADTADAVHQAVLGIDVGGRWALPDGTYNTQLRLDGQIAQGFDWAVSPDGIPGIPVAPTATPRNRAPIIQSVSCNPCQLWPGGRSLLTADVVDPDGDDLYVLWEAYPRVGTILTPSPTMTLSHPTSTPTHIPTWTRTPTPLARWGAVASLGSFQPGPDQFSAYYLADFAIPPGQTITIAVVLRVRDRYQHTTQGALQIVVTHPLTLTRHYFPLVVQGAVPVIVTATPSHTPEPSRTRTPFVTRTPYWTPTPHRTPQPPLFLTWSSTEADNTYSVAWGDYDSDGDLDLAAGNRGQPVRLYLNDGGTLTSTAVWSSVETESGLALAWGDYDSDGDLDLAAGGSSVLLYRNDGGVLTAGAIWSAAEADATTTSMAWGDVDNDGDLDLVVGNDRPPNRLYRNDNGTLLASAVWASRETDHTWSVAWGDYDGDGDLDLAVGNWGQPNRLYRNAGGMLTTNAVWSSREADSTRSVAWGDYDGDGDLDLAVGNGDGDQPNRLYRNEGGQLTGEATWSSLETDDTQSVAWGDYDADGDLDLAVGNGGLAAGQPNRLYRNTDGELTTSAIWASVEADNTLSVAWGDYDGDGDLDLAVGNFDQPNRLYRNH